MQLPDTPLHLAYCTNIHPAETWAETFAALQKHTLRVRDRIAPEQPFAIGLRLSDLASRELIQKRALTEFRHWLDRANCYVFTINGFPYGQFHQTRVKEQVYRPDWTTRERLEYTLRLFEILSAILPENCEGSVSTLPGSFKEFGIGKMEREKIFAQAWQCARGMARLMESSGRGLHLGFEPEPLGYFEDMRETLSFFEGLREHPDASAELAPLLGVNYDTCHLAIEFEDPVESLRRFEKESIRISKIHLSSALQLQTGPGAAEQVRRFDEPTYLHQVVIRDNNGLEKYRDLPDAFAALDEEKSAEARIHFHVPLHWEPAGDLGTTYHHTAAILEEVRKRPGICSHLEIETYTWSVLPEELRSLDVVDQLEKEYRKVLGDLRP